MTAADDRPTEGGRDEAASRGPAARLPVAGGAETRAVVAELARPRRGLAAVTFLVLLAASAVGLAGPLLLGVIVDRVTSGDGAGSITAPALGLLAVALVDAALTAGGAALVPALGQPMLADLRERVVDRALHVPAERLERSGRGDLLSRVSDDVNAVADAVVEVLPSLAGAALTIVLSFGGLAVLDWRLALAGLVAVPIQLLAVRWFLPRAKPMYAHERAVSGDRAQAVLEAVGGARTIRALSLGDAELPRVAAASQAGVEAVARTMRTSTTFFARLNVAELAGTAGVLIAGFLLVRSGDLSIGDATAGALLFVRLFDQFNVVLGTLDAAQRALASLERLVGVATLELSPRPAPTPATGGGAVELRGVGHAYADGPPVLHDVDLHVAPGERVALVGVSGAGKTTLAKVVAGFHVPTTGSLHLADHGHDRPVVLVTQEVQVFAGPLADDLRLARPDATDAQLHDALGAAGAGEWVAALPEGLDTVVGAGGHPLTAAQAQQVALARLALADPPVAVLDEATAEAGSAGARALEAAADRILAGRTALVVAHRLTQAAAADRVVVMAEGRIVETGTHDALVAAGGVYAGLWRAWAAER